MTLPKLHVAVLMGGWSNERPVSLMSGAGVADALEERGHTVTRIDMDRSVALRLSEAKPDVVFNALHGVPGEDGTVQGMLDLMGIPYTHSGLATSVIAIDKELTKQALVPHGIPMPGGRVVHRDELFAGDLDAVASLLGHLSPAHYRDSEWCTNGRNALAACDSYVLHRVEWVATAGKEMGVEYFLKFAVGKAGQLVLLVSCHLS